MSTQLSPVEKPKESTQTQETNPKYQELNKSQYPARGCNKESKPYRANPTSCRKRTKPSASREQVRIFITNLTGFKSETEGTIGTIHVPLKFGAVPPMKSLELDMPRCNTSSEGTAAAATPSPDLTITDWAAFWRSNPPSLPKKAMTVPVQRGALWRSDRDMESGKRGWGGEESGALAEVQGNKKHTALPPSPTRWPRVACPRSPPSHALMPVGSRQRLRSASRGAVHTAGLLLPVFRPFQSHPILFIFLLGSTNCL